MRSVPVEVLGHLIYYLPKGLRGGISARTTVPSGTAVGHLPEILGIPREEVQSVLVNGVVVKEPSAMLSPHDRVVVLPTISGG